MGNKNTTKSKSALTTRSLIKILSMVCMVFVFCPSFLVSCSSQEVDVSVMTAVNGVSMYGESVAEPHPIMLICLLIPIAVLVLMFTKKFSEIKAAMITMVAMIIDFVVWIIFKTSVQKLAEKNYCVFETTPWFYINMFSIGLIIVLATLTVARKLQMGTDLVTLFSGGEQQNIIGKTSSATKSQTAHCPNCNATVVLGDKFCASCGGEIPESLFVREETTKASLSDDRALFCQQCGAKLGSDDVFCEKCGFKIE